MGASDRLFNRQRSLHQILGGGLVADVMLWRPRHLTIRILAIALSAWIVFEKSGYTLLTLVSSVLLLLFSILFLWAKSAAILNRPAPPLPQLYLSQEKVNEVATVIQYYINVLLSASQDIALGKDSGMFCRVAAGLLLVSVIGSLTDILTLGYCGLVFALTVPALYERYEDHIENCLLKVYRILQHLYRKMDAELKCKDQDWILEKEKLS